MAATLYTGTGSAFSVSNAVNGVSFKPDLVWIKGRSAAYNHALFDVNRGARNVLSSNTTAAEVLDTAGTSMTSFDAGGFSLGTNSATASTNVNGSTFVGWQWKAGGAAVSNTAGSITSSVSANTTAGFSVVTWTGTGSNATVGHGLGVAPAMIIVKNRSTVTDWPVYCGSLTTPSTQFMTLNLTAAFATSAAIFGAASTSTTFAVGTHVSTNGSTNSMVAYCFAPVAGYSAFGSYTGNGSADGPFVYLGFRPRFVMYKRTDSTGNWFIDDSSRVGYNVIQSDLLAEASNAEGNYNGGIDFLSNGFKLKATANGNASGGTFIFMAFAEVPFKFANAR